MNYNMMTFEPCPICGNDDLSFSIKILHKRGLYDRKLSEVVAGSVECSKCGCELNHVIARSHSDKPIFMDLIVKEQAENRTLIEITDKFLSMFSKIRKDTIEKWNSRSAS